MDGPGFARVALIGCGHIGGSWALALRRVSPTVHVRGFDTDATAAARAFALGLVDALAEDVTRVVRDAELVLLAAPVRAIPELARTIAAHVTPGAIVSDVGSTKAEIVAACEAALAGRAHFVGAHPMAGTERSGPDAADARLFEGRAVVLTPTAATDAAAGESIATMWRALGARVVLLAPAAHDAAIAAVSHLPHIAAFALAGTLADEATALAGLAGGSFDSGTRVAASSAAAWMEILLANRAALVPWVERFAARVEALREALVADDSGSLGALLTEAGAARARVLGKHP